MLYGCIFVFFVYMLLCFGIEVIFVDMINEVEFCGVVKVNLKMIFVEMLINLIMVVFDLSLIVDVVK